MTQKGGGLGVVRQRVATVQTAETQQRVGRERAGGRGKSKP